MENGVSDLPRILKIALLHTDKEESYGQRLQCLFEEWFQAIIEDYNNHSLSSSNIVRKFHQPIFVELVKVDALNENYPTTEEWNSFDGVLVPGSSSSAFENEKWILGLKNIIRKLFVNRKPLLGICFGHQIINAALGGKVAQNKHGTVVGRVSSEITTPLEKTKSFMQKYTTISDFSSNGAQKISLLHSHRDIVTSLPSSFAVLLEDGSLQQENVRCWRVAGSQNSENNVMFHASGEGLPFVFTVQGHPELSTNSGVFSFRDISYARFQKTKDISEIQLQKSLKESTASTDSLVIGRIALELFLRGKLDLI
ncbi:putative glutamine amidotransferase-like protein [Cardiosporidium cionae]|uniref:Glutamine amidotransferase-like protein n=1 Tax=Cardiosporidium cionae TaxID=476202 RepID=A0ABQ7J4Y2_9APIC|nr:putative glutamine amidotransferase-like protein [Cardiosporidium cionae]|eukprot:KAF8817836.1 putative glutamine amidotransferase-like protein [Cardiosporidium cionae]